MKQTQGMQMEVKIWSDMGYLNLSTLNPGHIPCSAPQVKQSLNLEQVRYNYPQYNKTLGKHKTISLETYLNE